jgi:hypothetical protein
MNTMPDKNPPTAPSKALTIPAKRLAGSVECMNCGTALQGPFCHYCGQPDKNLMRFFPVLMRELMQDFMDFDSRFMRTLKPLLMRPGKLTRDYLDGRRFRYVPPLRLYVFSSIVFFFLAALLTNDLINFNTNSVGDEQVVTGIHLGEEDREDIEEALQELEAINPNLAKTVQQKIDGEAEQNIGGEDEQTGEAGAAKEAKPEFNFNGEPWDRVTNPLILPLMPDFVNEWINDEIEQSPQKGKEIEANPDLIKDKVFDVLPVTMFVLLPIVALLFKFWYLFARKYYVEHLIFALHNHAYIFVSLLLTLLLNSLADWREPAEDGPLTTAVTWTSAIILSWIPIYLLVSLKRVYRQGWAMTVAKYSVIGISYVILLSFATVFVALLSFLLL